MYIYIILYYIIYTIRRSKYDETRNKEALQVHFLCLQAVKVLHLRSLRLRRTAERDLTRLARELRILKDLPPHPRASQGECLMDIV